MTAPNPEPENDSPRFRAAFATLLAEIRAVPEHEFASINVDISSSVTTALGAGGAIRKLRDQIVREAPCFDIALVDRLELYALALGHAHTAYQTATATPVLLTKIVNEGLQWRTVLVNDATTLISRGLLKAGVLGELKGVNGYKNVAFDLFALSNVYRKRWDSLADRTSMQRQELDLVENLADQLLTAVGEREHTPATVAQAVRDRKAAFTLFIEAYDEVRAVIAFVRRKQGGADTIAPSLYARRGTKKKPPIRSEMKEQERQPSPALPKAATVVASVVSAAEPVFTVQDA